MLQKEPKNITLIRSKMFFRKSKVGISIKN